MKALSVFYDDNEDISEIAVSMTANEALALANVLGKMNGHAHQKLNIDSDMYDCLSTIFNRHYEDGYPQLDFDLATLNVGRGE